MGRPSWRSPVLRATERGRLACVGLLLGGLLDPLDPHRVDGNTHSIFVRVNGGGIRLLVKDRSEHADEVARLIKEGVRFVPCENTLRDKSIPKENLLPLVGTVPSGVVEVVRKQHEGYGYSSREHLTCAAPDSPASLLSGRWSHPDQAGAALLISPPGAVRLNDRLRRKSRRVTLTSVFCVKPMQPKAVQPPLAHEVR